MNPIVTKAVAAVTPVEESDEYPNGAFDIILSSQSLDRDGDTLKSTEWKSPLPEHITMDFDHGMTVATTVGSGSPFVNDDGDLQVRGTYSSIPRAQEVRTLVNEGHVRTTSVAFMTRKDKKSGSVERELLNGAFVAVPANPDAVILSSKALDTSEPVTRESFCVGAKGLSGSVEDLQERLDDALSDLYPDTFVYVRATFLTSTTEGTVVYVLRGDSLSRSFTDNGTSVELGDEVTDVAIITSVVPEEDETEKSETKADTKSADDEKAAAQAAAESKSADEVELRARALIITAQSQAL